MPSGQGPSFRLTVPGGVVSTRPGAWGSVSPQPTPADIPAGAPTADFHIHGAWTGSVYVGGPPDDVGAEVPGQWTDTVWHLPADGQWELSWGGAVDRVDGRVTTATRSLSFFSTLRQKASQFGAWVGETAVKVATWVENTLRRFLGTGAPAPICNPNTPAGRQPDGAFLGTFGELLSPRPLTPPLWHCIEREDADTATWRYVLNRGVSLYVHADDPAAGRARVTSLGVTGDILVDLFAVLPANAAKNTSLPLLWAATSSLDVSLESSAGSGNLFVNGGLQMAAATLIVRALTESSALIPAPFGDLYGLLSSCVWGAASRARGSRPLWRVRAPARSTTPS